MDGERGSDEVVRPGSRWEMSCVINEMISLGILTANLHSLVCTYISVRLRDSLLSGSQRLPTKVSHNA